MPSGSRTALVQLSKESDKGSRSSSASTSSSNSSPTTAAAASILTASKHGFSAKQDEVVSDYEKRIAFIQKQHEKLLVALHREMEQLKRKNKG